MAAPLQRLAGNSSSRAPGSGPCPPTRAHGPGRCPLRRWPSHLQTTTHTRRQAAPDDGAAARWAAAASGPLPPAARTGCVTTHHPCRRPRAPQRRRGLAAPAGPAPGAGAPADTAERGQRGAHLRRHPRGAAPGGAAGLRAGRQEAQEGGWALELVVLAAGAWRWGCAGCWGWGCTGCWGWRHGASRTRADAPADEAEDACGGGLTSNARLPYPRLLNARRNSSRVSQAPLGRAAAGLDYWPYVCVNTHQSWDAFFQHWQQLQGPKRLVAYTGARGALAGAQLLPGAPGAGSGSASCAWQPGLPAPSEASPPRDVAAGPYTQSPSLPLPQSMAAPTTAAQSSATGRATGWCTAQRPRGCPSRSAQRTTHSLPQLAPAQRATRQPRPRPRPHLPPPLPCCRRTRTCWPLAARW
jgi:hypothetical protein